MINNYEVILPSIDKIPLMGHPLLQKILLVFTFILHLIPMNIMIGSLLIAIFLKVKSLLFNKNEYEIIIYNQALKLLTVSLSFTITFGVAPLLFLQALYGPIFYSSTILMAYFWLAILIFIVISYYIFYILSLTPEKVLKPLRLPLLIIAFLGICYAALMFISNSLLMQSPQKFFDIYNSYISGLYIYLADPIIIFKLLHVFLSSIILSTITLLLIFIFKNYDTEFKKYSTKFLKSTLIIAIFLQIVIGFSMLFFEPKNIFNMFLNFNSYLSILLLLSILLIIIALILTLNLKENNFKNTISLTITSLIIITIMALMRDFIRDVKLNNVFSYLNNPYQWNYPVIIAFVLILGLGLVTVYYMLFKLEYKKEC